MQPILFGALKSVITKPIQLLSMQDVGIIASKVFLQPDKYIGKSIALAGDELTPEQIRATFLEVTQSRLSRLKIPVPAFLIRRIDNLDQIIDFYNNQGHAANIKELKETVYDGLLTWKDFVSKWHNRKPGDLEWESITVKKPIKEEPDDDDDDNETELSEEELIEEFKKRYPLQKLPGK